MSMNCTELGGCHKVGMATLEKRMGQGAQAIVNKKHIPKCREQLQQLQRSFLQ